MLVDQREFNETQERGFIINCQNQPFDASYGIILIHGSSLDRLPLV